MSRGRAEDADVLEECASSSAVTPSTMQSHSSCSGPSGAEATSSSHPYNQALRERLSAMKRSELAEFVFPFCTEGWGGMRSEMQSARIGGWSELRSKFDNQLEFDVESSKSHWTEVTAALADSDDSDVQVPNSVVFEEMKKHPEWGPFFQRPPYELEIGAKIAEGGQAEIFEALGWTKYDARCAGNKKIELVLKVFKKGFRLVDLQRMWPPGIASAAIRYFGRYDSSESFRRSFPIETGLCWALGAYLWDDGRFVFVFDRHWGDLRKLIDNKMYESIDSCPPFRGDYTCKIILAIAKSMCNLHTLGIVHHDLKAANILVHDPGESFAAIADFECSVGIRGTGFWRAPEVLLALKTGSLKRETFTQQTDVYGFAMTCYEIITGLEPFEGHKLDDYDIILQGERPQLPKDDILKPLYDLVRKCWHQDPDRRPLFGEIDEYLEKIFPSAMRKEWRISGRDPKAKGVLASTTDGACGSTFACRSPLVVTTMNSSRENSSDDMDEEAVSEEAKMEQKDEEERTALERAEEIEMRNATSGLHWEVGAVAQPMRLEEIQRGPPAIGLLQLDAYGSLSHALALPQVRREYGFPQALAVHANFIAVGLSKGAVLVTPSKYSATRSADELESQKAFFLGGGIETKEPVSSLCFSHQGDLLLVGYANGILRLWDVSRRSMSKVMTTEHSEAIVHTLFLGQDAPGARSLRVISGDCKGRLLLHAFSQQIMPLLRRYSVETQCLLEGDKTGPVLSVSPLLPDEGLQATNGTNSPTQGRTSQSPTLGSVMGGMGSVVGGMVGSVGGLDVGRKFIYDGATPSNDGSRPMFVLVTHHTVLVVRLAADMQVRQPALEVMSKLSRPMGIRDGAIAYTAWRRFRFKSGSSVVPNRGNSTGSTVSGAPTIKDEGDTAEDDDDLPMLAMGWDTKMFIWQLTHSNLRKVKEWELDSPAVGLAWLEEQMLVVVTAKDELCLFTREGVELERGSIRGEQEGVGSLIYHTHIMNALGNPEKAYHSSLSVRGAALYLMGPQQLWRARLLPWRERIKALEDAGDWMGAFHIAMELYDGRARGVTGLPRGLDAMREAIMSTLLALLSAYIDQVFEYLLVAFKTTDRQGSEGLGQEAREEYARVGGVAIEFCVHIGKQDVLFENVFSKFVAVGQRGIFLELLEPYILKDMLGSLAPEVMQALVEHYSFHGWLERVEQCVLHMDIGSLDFNQVVRLCREHGLYSALIYLFNRGLDDFRSPLEELLTVADQASNPSQTQMIGYKLLVYLKYCFSGLAFPPGHGSLPASRLPGLRAEILQFLLDQEGSIRGRSLTSFKAEEARVYPRLWFLLHVDMQATLLVLRLAFPEHGPLGIGKQGFAYLTSADDEESVLSASEDVHDGVRYVQATVNALIEISKKSHKVRSDSEEAEDSDLHWPSEEDVGHLLDFVAQFVASRHAVVSSSTFMRILEYVASPTLVSDVARAKEDLMVRLLSVVPDSNLDLSRTLQLAQLNNFWQVSGLLHTRRGDYEAALDDYLSDITRTAQPFLYVMQMLDEQKGLKGSDLIKFRESILLHIPELVQRSRKGTLWIVLKHFSSDNQKVMEKLASRRKLLFAYLKGIMDSRPGGDNLSALKSSGEEHKDRQKPTSGTDEWDPNVDIRDLFRRSNIDLTDDMAELYVELLCQFEPHGVLQFLERFENYRLEHCLKLCQEYGVTDAAIFLLERVGDVASALNLVLKDIKKCRDTLELFISTSSSASLLAFDISKLLFNVPEVVAMKAAVAAALALCQRNTARLNPQESTLIWFRLLDSTVEPSKGASNPEDTLATKNSSPRSHRNSEKYESGDSGRGMSKAQRKLVKEQAKGRLLKKVLVSIMEDIIDGMMGYIPLHVIMEKILADHGNHPFGDFRFTILNMLSAYGYERTILRTAKHLIEEDTFYNINALRQGYSHGLAVSSSTCCVCGLGLDDDTLEGRRRNGSTSRAGSRGLNGFSIFSCGHAAHIACVVDGASIKEDKGVIGCPVCLVKVKSSTSSKKATVNEDIIGSLSTSHNIVAGHSAVKSYHHAPEISRLALLKQLQQGKQLSDLGPSLKLHLAPPKRGRPRRASVPDSSTTSRSRPVQKISTSLRR